MLSSHGPAPEELRVVLLGKTGAGKSSLGNTLLGRDAFRAEVSFSSVTFKCSYEEAVRFGTLLQVTDTPGVSDTDRQDKEVLKEVAKSVAVASPGPHVIIMVFRCDNRFTNEENTAYKILRRLFGEGICKFLIVVFTGANSQGTPQEREAALAQAIHTAPPTLKKVLEDAGGRYCSVDNMASRAERDQQALTILTTIKSLEQHNRGAYFTNQMCEKVNREVETVVRNHMATDHTTHEAALRETRREIVEDRVEPGFFSNLADIVGKYIVPAAGMVLSVVAPIVIRAAISRCSVM